MRSLLGRVCLAMRVTSHAARRVKLARYDVTRRAEATDPYVPWLRPSYQVGILYVSIAILLYILSFNNLLSFLCKMYIV